MNGIQQAIDDFLLTGKQAGWSKATVKTYRWHLDQLADWLAQRDVTTPDRITARLVRAYGAGMTDGWEPATCKTAVIAIRSWLKWAADAELADIGLDAVLKTPRVPENIQRTVDAGEIDALLAFCERPYESGGLTASQGYCVNVRNRAIVALLFDALLRSGELCGLRVDDVDMEKRSVMIRKGKGGSDGIGHFSEATAVYLADWLKLRPFVALESCDALFVGVTGNTPGQGITSYGLRSIMRGLSKRAGVRHLSPHAFRRGGAVQAVINGASSRVVRDMGRWRHLDMVEVYTRSLDANTLHDKYAPMHAVRGAAEVAA
jgi:site-specific recombinase XerD